MSTLGSVVAHAGDQLQRGLILRVLVGSAQHALRNVGARLHCGLNDLKVQLLQGQGPAGRGMLGWDRVQQRQGTAGAGYTCTCTAGAKLDAEQQQYGWLVRAVVAVAEGP